MNKWLWLPVVLILVSGVPACTGSNDTTSFKHQDKPKAPEKKKSDA